MTSFIAYLVGPGVLPFLAAVLTAVALVLIVGTVLDQLRALFAGAADGGPVRRALDAAYGAGGALASLFLIAILGIIVAQMLARWTGQVFPGATSYAGYCMASASFLALAYALNHGAHIRVSLVLSNLGQHRRWGEIWATTIAAITATFFARYALKANYWSHKLNDISQGQDRMPLWIPQMVMSIGTILLAVALWDHVVRLVLTDHAGVAEPDITERHE